MNKDYKKLIAELFNSGATAEEIAKEFTEALNAHEAASNLEKSRAVKFDELSHALDDLAFREDDSGPEYAALMLTETRGYLEKTWDGVKITEFEKYMIDGINKLWNNYGKSTTKVKINGKEYKPSDEVVKESFKELGDYLKSVFSPENMKMDKEIMEKFFKGLGI